MISLIIPTNGRAKEYTQNLLNNINKLYPNNKDIEIIIEENNSVNLSQNYNNAIAKAKGDKIILLHNDMVLSKGFIETMSNDIKPKTITTYTRVEPPIYNDIYPGKVIVDCGHDLETFDENKFNNLELDIWSLEGGSQLFFGCYKEDWIGLDGDTFEMFCEDDDLHLRYKILNFKHIVSPAYVYHFVSKTSRQTEKYQQIEQQSNIDFIKKWGFRNSKYNVCYNKKVTILNPRPEIENLVKPFFNDVEDIEIVIDGNKFTQEDFSYIQNLNDIIKYNDMNNTIKNESKFSLGNLIVYINKINEIQHFNIHLNHDQN